MTYTDQHTGKQYQLGEGFYSRTVTQYPAGCKVHFDGSSNSSKHDRRTVTFETQAARSAWLRMMGFTK
jgi:hypothetical protein